MKGNKSDDILENLLLYLACEVHLTSFLHPRNVFFLCGIKRGMNSNSSDPDITWGRQVGST